MASNETEIWRDYSYSRVKLTGQRQMKWLLYLFLVAMVIVLLFIPIIGWILEVPLIYFGIKYIRKFVYNKGKPVFILTSLRAIVKLNDQILQECQLANCVVSSINKRGDNLSGSSTFGGISRTGLFSAGTISSGLSASLGDVLFIENGVTKVKFEQVQDPDGVANTANQLISALRASQPQVQTQRAAMSTKYCINCGTSLTNSNTKFCPNCGAQL
jgi:hypothetical protein